MRNAITYVACFVLVVLKKCEERELKQWLKNIL